MLRLSSHFSSSPGAWAGSILAIVLFPTAVLSAWEPAQSFVVESLSNRAEVTVNVPARKITVRVIDQTGLGLPDFVQIWLFRADGRRTDLEVRAIEPTALSADAQLYRNYSGSIASALDSYVGAAIRIPLTGGSK